MRFILLINLILAVICFSLQAQVNNIKFDHLSSEQGLSHNSVNSIIQDKQGFMWFGTHSGLNRYDGYNLVTFEHDPADISSLSNNIIRFVYEDRSGILWVGTSRGLNKFDNQTQKFTLIQHDPANIKSISDNDIHAIYEDRSGILWIGTMVGLNKFDRKTNTFTLYQHHPNHPKNWANNIIQTIYEDRSGNLWVGTTKGLSRFDRQTGKFTRFIHHTHPEDSTRFTNSVRTIVEDKSGSLWIGTVGDGLKQFDQNTGTFKVFLHSPRDTHSLSDNLILSLLEDSFGTLWIGTQEGGLNAFDKATGQFKRYQHNSFDKTSISHKSILTIYEDRSKVLWVGAFMGGVNKVDLLKKKFAHYQHPPQVADSLHTNFIFSMYEDKSGAIWMGNPLGFKKWNIPEGTFTHYSYSPHALKSPNNYTAHCIYEDRYNSLWIGLSGGGLKEFNKQTKQFTSYLHDPSEPQSLPHDYINAIYEDKAGTLWVGTRNGLCKFERKTKKWITYRPSYITFIKEQFNVSQILEDQCGTMWLATGRHGLNQFDPLTGAFIQYTYKNNTPQAEAFKEIDFIFEDKRDNFWLSLASGGLYLFNRKTKKFKPIPEPVNLSKIAIKTITEDERGNLWMSTVKNGLIKYNPESKIFRNYDVSDGLQGNEFNRAFCRSVTGLMYFAGNNGFNVFHPDSIQDNPYIPPVVITNFKVFDKPRSFSEKEIELPYSDNFFSFDFAALSYALPERNRYAYMLDNFDENWINPGNRRYASYTNLDPGKYVFRVKAANHDRVWNEEGKSITIIITPPLWKTWWAYLSYFLLATGLLMIWRQYTLSRERLKADLKLKSMESSKLHELDQMKTKFFTNISHEFRTPLTLIISPLEKILSGRLDKNTEQEYHQLMYKNAKRLLNLINQLLDISKAEAGRMSLETTEGDIVSFIRENVYTFKPVADSLQIKINFSCHPEIIQTHFDQDKLEKIITNLLSNAFKFTPEGGEIWVAVAIKYSKIHPHTKPNIEIAVKDNGVGIPPEMKDKIFDRFFQVDSSYTYIFEGTGIGLSITKELVELHGGTINVSSETGKGTCFIIKIPFITAEPSLMPAQDLEDVLDKQHSKFRAVYADSTDGKNALAKEIKPWLQTENGSLPLVLVVEDNADLRSYIATIFNDTYRIREAKDGTEGFTIATEIIPDLIITDWMMPKMDGIQLCSQLKTNERTSHIPVVLLTAKGQTMHKLEALETGADAYIAKPFLTEELSIQVRNLILQRKKLREQFSRDLTLQPVATATTSTDEKFMQRFIQIIEDNLSFPDFSIETLEKEIGMSHGQLYRKIKALTNESPGEFLRTYRVKKAAFLLSQKQGNISQVAYQTGFNNLSYFTKCFRQLYGMTPSEYISSQDKVDLQ